MRGALVTTRWDDPWSEEDLAVRRVAGAIACAAELDVLVPGARQTTSETSGALRVMRLHGAPPDPARRRAVRDALFGPFYLHGPTSCACYGDTARAWARDVPLHLQWDALAAEGSDSPDLAGHLLRETYDFVVFAGCSAAAYSGMQALPSSQPVAFVPLATRRPLEWLPILDHVFERADALIAFSEGEARLLEERAGQATDVTNVEFVFRVHELVHTSDPHGYEVADRVAIVTDWRDKEIFAEMRKWIVAASDQFPGLEFRPLGPGADRLPFPYTTPLSEGRLDTWRWMARSVAALDPLHHRLLGRTAIEALQYGVPVLAPTTGGATQEHAERGNGGLWYRSFQDLVEAIALVRADAETRSLLSEHGRTYAEERYGDTKRFITAVTDVVERITA